MLASVLLAASVAAVPSPPLFSVNARVFGDPVNYALGARLGMRAGPVEIYGGIDPFQAIIAFDDQVTDHTLPLTLGARAYFRLRSGIDLFGALEASGWNETIHADYTETHRRGFALVGARSIPSPFFYDVSLGPGFWRRRWPASGGGDSAFAFSVQGSVGIAF